MTVWIILPAFNEENSIPLIFPQIEKVFKGKGFKYRLIVIEDGSIDSTSQILEKIRLDFPLDIIMHKINRGLGETERDGFEYAAEHSDDDDIIVRLDCDNTHNTEYIFKMIDKIREGFDVVNTSRFQPGGGQLGVDVYRAFISYSANIFMRVVFKIKGVKDFSCGYRAYRAKIIKDAINIFGNGFIQLKGLGFTSTLEMLVKLNLMGCRFAEVPFVLRYDKKSSPSKMVSSITTLGYITMAILYHWPWGGWRCFYKDLAKTYMRSSEEAYDKYAKQNARRTMICQIGG